MYYLKALIFMVLLGLATAHPTLSSLSYSVSIRDDSGKIQTEFLTWTGVNNTGQLLGIIKNPGDCEAYDFTNIKSVKGSILMEDGQGGTTEITPTSSQWLKCELHTDINCQWDGVQNCNIIESVDEHDGGDLQQLCVHTTLENTGSINDLSQLKAFRCVVMYP